MVIGNCPVCGAEMRVGSDMTNADRIRAMTDEELADEYIRIYNQLDRYTDSWAWLRDWLIEEAKE